MIKAMLDKTCLQFLTTLLVLVLIPAVAAADLKVVTTIGDFAAMSRAILQDDGETEQLVRSGEDPHFVDPRPSYARQLNQADMVVYVGLELEVGWLPTLITRSRNSGIQSGQPGHLDASQYIQPQQVPAGSVDRSMGDVHPGGNPHYNLDPRQMARVAMAFGDALGELRPAMAEEFHERSREFARESIRYAQHWEEKFEALPDEARQLIGYHNAWAYIDSWLDVDTPIQLEPRPGVPPNPRHISEVIDTIDSRNIGVIAQLEYYSTDTAESIAARSDRRVEVVSVPSQAREDQTYFEQMDNVIEPIYEAMRQSHDLDS